MHASSPVQKVISEFEIDEILQRDIESLWNNTATNSGISKEYFTAYIKDQKLDFAKIKNVKKIRTAHLLLHNLQVDI